MNKKMYEQVDVRITLLKTEDVVRTSGSPSPTAIIVEGEAIGWQEGWGNN